MQTRTCPHCKQDIPADSLKCHYCREWVNRKYPFKRALPWVIPLTILWLALIFLGPWWMERTEFREKKLWQHSSDIQIVSHHAGQDEESGLSVIGVMRNVSETPWKFVTIQVDYYDSKGRLVDTSQGSGSEVLPPSQERSFKVVFKKKLRGAAYDHYRVFVAGADDASRF